MDFEKIETEVKIHVQKWVGEAQLLIQRTSPAQLYVAVAVVVFTMLLLILSNILFFLCFAYWNFLLYFILLP